MSAEAPTLVTSLFSFFVPKEMHFGKPCPMQTQAAVFVSPASQATEALMDTAYINYSWGNLTGAVCVHMWGCGGCTSECTHMHMETRSWHPQLFSTSYLHVGCLTWTQISTIRLLCPTRMGIPCRYFPSAAIETGHTHLECIWMLSNTKASLHACLEMFVSSLSHPSTPANGWEAPTQQTFYLSYKLQYISLQNLYHKIERSGWYNQCLYINVGIWGIWKKMTAPPKEYKISISPEIEPDLKEICDVSEFCSK